MGQRPNAPHWHQSVIIKEQPDLRQILLKLMGQRPNALVGNSINKHDSYVVANKENN